MKILGIDPGSTLMGYGLIEEGPAAPRLISNGVLKIKSRDQAEKLLELYQKVELLIKKSKPGLAGLEKLYFAKNQKTAFEVSQARGVILLALKKNNIPVIELSPGQIKVAVAGYGKADKQAVAKMAARFVGLTKLEGDDNATDAVAIALTASQLQKSYPQL